MSILSKHIVIVTGKGGVGKSTVAASLALKAVKEKKKTLLVELGEDSFYGQFFGLKGISNVPQVVPECGFEVAMWDTESCLREYVLHYIKIEGLFKLFFENKVMRTFINVAPALKELAILGKLTSGERNVGPEFHYDLVVVDGYASGHMLSLLRAPKGMSEVIKGGPMGYHSAAIYRVLTDPSITSYAIVTLPDELPIVEAMELETAFRTEFNIKPDFIVNRMLKPPVSEPEIAELRGQVAETSGLGSFLRYLDATMIRQKKNVERLASSNCMIQELPLAYGSLGGIELMRSLAGVLMA